MKSIFLVPIALLLLAIAANAQTRFTPYDEIPGVDKSVKPAFSENYSGWMKMLYQYPVNFNELQDSYRQYLAENPGAKSEIVRYYKIWSRAVAPHVNENGEIVIPDSKAWQMKLQEARQLGQQRLKSATVGNSGWQFLGPKVTTWMNDKNLNQDRLEDDGHPKECPWQVNIYSLDVAADKPGVLFCGTETGFVNKTTNNGLSWEPVGNNYPFGGAITAVAINPRNSDTVYVCGGSQVHMTSDAGASWKALLPSGKTFNASRLKMAPGDPNILVAAASEGLYISHDAGATWIQKWTRPVFDVDFKPGTSDTIYGLSKNTSGDYTFLVSTNKGNRFDRSADFPNTYYEHSGGLLAVTPANPKVLYATMLATSGSETVPYILKGIENAGSITWTEVKKGQTKPEGGLSGFTTGQGYFDLVLEVAPEDEDLVFWGTCVLWKSTNGAKDFTPVGGYQGKFQIHPDIQDLKVLPGGEVWVSTDGGMSYSTDYFVDLKNFSTRSNGILGSDMWGFDQGWNEDLVVGGRYHNGNTAIAGFYSGKALRLGGAESATGWVIKGRSRHATFDDLGNGWILPDKSDGLPEGRFVFSKYPNMDEYGGRRGNLVQHPNYYGTIYLGESNSFWRSTDLGQTFDMLYSFPGQVRYLQISQLNPDILYADIINYGLYRSIDGGITWEQKPALTGGSYGTSFWNGKLFFVLSPTRENTIYACLQNGTWSSDKGKVFRSDDGGDTWINWSGGLSEYTKNLVIQPTAAGTDRVYLFTNSRNGDQAKVYTRVENELGWQDYSDNYPAGMMVNQALPFYRDSKIRVGGNAGVWEVQMKDTVFTPLVNPWVEKSVYDCMEDTLYFDDHSILNHSGASWQWNIQPQPAFIDDTGKRNPKVVLGSPGTYDVTLTVSVNGESYSKTISKMVTTATCPTVNDCGNPGMLDKSQWSLLYVDSEEKNSEDGSATFAFDDDPETIWHTEWYYNSPLCPHEIQIDLGDTFNVSSFVYLPRQNGANGRIKGYELYLSEESSNWGTPVLSGAFPGGAAAQTITFEVVSARYMRLKALSELNGNPWTSVAEIDLKGCYGKNITSIADKTFENLLHVYPVPCSDRLSVQLPASAQLKNGSYQVFNQQGALIKSGPIDAFDSTQSINVQELVPALYYLRVFDGKQEYRIKFVKK